MGLNITAIADIGEKVANNWIGWRTETDYPDDDVCFISEGHHSRQAEGYDGVYLQDGLTHKFAAGSYIGYNTFRGFLTQAIYGKDPEEIWTESSDVGWGDPFYEIIDFTDCNGVVGPETSAKLFQDFDEYEEQFKNYAQENCENKCEKIVRLYGRFRAAFKVASDTGVVIFH